MAGRGQIRMVVPLEKILRRLTRGRRRQMTQRWMSANPHSGLSPHLRTVRTWARKCYVDWVIPGYSAISRPYGDGGAPLGFFYRILLGRLRSRPRPLGG